jgi:predicted RNase H-like HicB family nuclease
MNKHNASLQIHRKQGMSEKEVRASIERATAMASKVAQQKGEALPQSEAIQRQMVSYAENDNKGKR